MNKKFIKKQQSPQRGFTLIELIVSVGIFAIVITMSISTLLVMVDANRRAQGHETAMTNLSFVVDSITRNIRTGYDYYCRSSSISTLPSVGVTQDCSGGENIVFTSERTGDRVGYRKNGSTIERKINNGEWLQVTSDDLTVETFEVTVNDTNKFYDDADEAQPTVKLTIKGSVFEGLESEVNFNLQTDIVQRTLDY